MDFNEIWYLSNFRKTVEKIQVSLISDKKKSTLLEDQYTFMIMSRSVILRMINISDRRCRENQNARFVPKLPPPFPPPPPSRKSCRYEIMWKNVVQPDRPQMTIWRMRIACWITKATNTHSEYVILIAFPPQQWLHERASMLHYTHIACFVKIWQERISILTDLTLYVTEKALLLILTYSEKGRGTY